ncbi:MAG: DUF2569 family protein [Sphingopyxis sp.]|nr:DUF2569 family protein [Sphingopyxis sp.]
MAEYQERQLRGVGGWLGLLVFILGIATPIRTLIETKTAVTHAAIIGRLLGPNVPTYVQFSWALAATCVVGALYLTYRLVAVHRWSTIGIVIVGLWCLYLLPAVIDAVVTSLLFPKAAGGMLIDALWSSAKGAVWATIWTTYLMASKRVANTYAKDEAEALT